MEIFDASTVDQFVEDLSHSIEAAVVYVKKSTLGGPTRPSVWLTVCLDPKDTWANGILQNSRHFKLYIYMDGEIGLVSDSGRKGHAGMMEHTALSKRWRKTKAKSFDEVVSKINKYIGEVV